MGVSVSIFKCAISCIGTKMGKNQVSEIEALTGEFINGKRGAGDKILSIVSNDLELAEQFVNSLSELLRQDNSVSIETIKLLNALTDGFMVELHNSNTEQGKERALEALREVIRFIQENKRAEDKYRYARLAVGGVIGVAALGITGYLIYKNPALIDAALDKAEDIAI